MWIPLFLCIIYNSLIDPFLCHHINKFCLKHIIILIITDLLLKSKIKQGYSKIAGHTLCTPVFWNDIPAFE